jgi:lysine-specific demethylase 8
MIGTSDFRPLPEATAQHMAYVRSRTPAVFRGMAADWPATRKWSFAHVASLSPDLPVKVVVGNRETNETRFAHSTLGAYIEILERNAPPEEEQVYLKEFDLLRRFPELRADLRRKQLFPRGSLSACSAWIGPTGARTGLHYDLLDNLAITISGTKRFYLAPPGTVEHAGTVSRKYDAWARLSRLGVAELTAGHVTTDDFFVIDLEPGDMLYVPAGWWHEVVNLSASMLLSGFFGTKAEVLSNWARVSARDVLHRCGVLGRGNCTCHGHSSGKKDNSQVA